MESEYDCDCEATDTAEAGKAFFWRCVGCGILFFFVSTGIGSCSLLMSITNINIPVG